MASRAATSRVDFRSPLPGALLRCLRVCTTSQIRADLRLSSPNLPSHGTQQSTHATPRVGCSERVQRLPEPPFSEPLLKRFDDRVCMSTVRTFVVAIFDQCDRGGVRTLDVIVRTDRRFQLRHSCLISEGSPEPRESRRPQG